ncbi:sugar ABC transporter substrate-binding protein [Microbacterium sediminis]|uniref:Sugar ABC transporter substrate-binding protein n=1 Tax=Microbacterium sediminis TaxID=904291 RepID=A0A1B9NG36_9MICO|nr:sugar ABC transporter substrate-binding protein [Microbacterium sediminis]OCG75581.1 sugar ABC transporter substrate-binding protein [Microbacterium sediminis]QBR73979.1 extracellular solute-binding protein [Microbacterium sediminis]
MRSRIISVAALGTVAALGLAGCSSGGGDTDDGTNAEGETLDVWIMESGNPDAATAFFDEVGAAFKEQTGADLNVEYIAWSGGQEYFTTAIAGGETPDVAEVGTTWALPFAEAGALMPLQDRIDEAGLGDGLVEGLAETARVDGELYGMPWYAGIRSLVYRADIFQELGLEAPTDWDSFLATAQAIKAAHPEMAAFAVPGAAEFPFYPWIWGNDAEIATQDGDEWVSELDSPEAIEAVEFYTGLQTEHGLSTAGAADWTEVDVRDAFTNGELAMAIMPNQYPGLILQDNPDMEGKIDAAPIPAKDGGVAGSFMGGSHLSMFNTAENQDLAWEFIELMTTGEFAQQWAEESGFFPGEQGALDAFLNSEDPIVSAYATQLQEGARVVPNTPQWGAVQAEAVVTTALRSILVGEATVEDAMTKAAEEMTATLNAG